MTISVGGEIGEVGERNSTEENAEAFINGFNRLKGQVAGVSKLSIQTGTHHGGVVLPDGTLAQVAIDFEVIRRLGEEARKSTVWAGWSSMELALCPIQLFINSSKLKPVRST